MRFGDNSKNMYEPIIGHDKDGAYDPERCGEQSQADAVRNNIDANNTLGRTHSQIADELEDSFEFHTPDACEGDPDPKDGGFESLVATLMRDMDYISVNQSAMNLAYTIFNAGLITIPVAAFQAGIPLFAMSITVMSLISAYITVMIISMANEKRVKTLEDLAEDVGGPRLFLAVSSVQFCMSFCMMCITLDVWADIVSDVFAAAHIHTLKLSTRTGQVFWGAVLILPLCLFKQSMISVRWTSYLSVICIAVSLVALTVAFMIQDEFVVRDTTSFLAPKSKWWLVVFVLMLCYSYNQRGFAVYRCMRARNTARWRAAVRKANVGVSCIYIFFGLCGYLTAQRLGVDQYLCFNFFEQNTMPQHHLYFEVIRVLVACCLLLTIPVDSLIASSTWRRLWRRLLPHSKSPTRRFPQQSQEQPILSVSSADLQRNSSTANQFTSTGADNDAEVSYKGPSSGDSGIISRCNFDADSNAAVGLLLDSERCIGVIAEGLDGEEDETLSGSATSSKTSKKLSSVASGSNSVSKRSASTAASSNSINSNSIGKKSSGAMEDCFSGGEDGWKVFEGSEPSERHLQHKTAAATAAVALDADPVYPEARNTDESIHSDRTTVVVGSGLGLHFPASVGTACDVDPDEQRHTSVLSSPVRNYSLEQKRRANTSSAESILSQSNSHSQGHSHSHSNNQHTFSYSYASQLSSVIADYSQYECGTLSTDGYYASYEEYCAARAASAVLDNSGSSAAGHSSNAGIASPNFGRKPAHGRGPLAATSLVSAQLIGWNMLTPLFLWVLSVIVAMLTKHWMVLAVVVSICTIALLFIFPTMIYFRMKLSSDFRAIPLCKGILPNRLYMTCVQICGIALLAFIAFAVVITQLNNDHLIEEHS